MTERDLLRRDAPFGTELEIPFTWESEQRVLRLTKVKTDYERPFWEGTFGAVRVLVLYSERGEPFSIAKVGVPGLPDECDDCDHPLTGSGSMPTDALADLRSKLETVHKWVAMLRWGAV